MSEGTAIDIQAFAREARALQGELPVASLSRVLDMIVEPAGSVKYRVQGRLGPRNRTQLLLQVDGTLSIRCQRCLGVISYPLKIRSVLEFIEDEEELSQEELEDDSRDFLPAQKECDVATLVEDEIILGFPVAPRHESCGLPVSAQEAGPESPFSVLSGLKGRTR